ncbi:MAG: glycosyltransferase family 2 protein [Anaerolineales bacterium]|nr:glycosyltransferase family 2 protein [Anaerolineales bacterium]MCL4257977.1 glycosyltransferase family 2 protein [Anaerolineales bacterium]
MSPSVSIIVPCFNEEATIGGLLEAILAQSYPAAQMEVVIADGMSTDGTRQRIATFSQQHPQLAVRVVDNPARSIPHGLNLAIAAAQGSTLLRLDAHSSPHPEYVARSLQALDEDKGWNVGGVWEIRPGQDTWLARAIAAAAAHPFGVGDARYRYTTQAGAVDTVPFGAFRRSLIERIGPFDETLQTNEDYEFNTRIRQAGGAVWLDPAIRSVYYARPTLGALAHQYWRYGYWKLRMLRRYPGSLRPRQAIPPLFVLALLGLGGLSLLWPPAAWLLGAGVVSYALLLLAAALHKAIELRQPSLLLGMPLAMMTMHFSWGAAFLWSLLSSGAPRKHTNGTKSI